MTKKEIDKIWTQTALNALDFEKIMKEKGWVKSTLAKYCGVGNAKMNRMIEGFEPERKEMGKILENLKEHCIHHVRVAIEAGNKAAQEQRYDFEMWGEDESNHPVQPSELNKIKEMAEIVKDVFIPETEECDVFADMIPVEELTRKSYPGGEEKKITIYKLYMSAEDYQIERFVIIRNGVPELFKELDSAYFCSYRELKRGDEIESSD